MEQRQQELKPALPEWQQFLFNFKNNPLTAVNPEIVNDPSYQKIQEIAKTVFPAVDPRDPLNQIQTAASKDPRIGGIIAAAKLLKNKKRKAPAVIKKDPGEQLAKKLNKNEPFAFVGKPCDISAIRQLSKIDRRVNELCKYLLTLVCGGFGEFTKSQDFIESFNVKEENLEIFRYRGNGNPGKMYIKTDTGEEYDIDYNSFWGEESTWRVPFRCKICPDAIGESADVAALDTWPGGSPKGEDEGFNAAIARTQKGLELMNNAIDAGYIKKGNSLSIEEISDFQPHQVKKKQAVFARHRGMKKNNLPTIETNRLRIKELYDLNDKEFNIKEEEGISKRVDKI